MPAATYFEVGNYGNSIGVYPGNINNPPDPRNNAVGLASAFLAGMIGPGLFGNLPKKELARYGEFSPGALAASTLLSAFPIFQRYPRLAGFGNVQNNPHDAPPPNGHPVPPYGNGFLFT
jgi:hypothetical protein